MLQKWREFCNGFEGMVEDWNMGTLLRVNCTEEVSEDNTTLGQWSGIKQYDMFYVKHSVLCNKNNIIIHDNTQEISLSC